MNNIKEIENSLPQNDESSEDTSDTINSYDSEYEREMTGTDKYISDDIPEDEREDIEKTFENMNNMKLDLMQMLGNDEPECSEEDDSEYSEEDESEEYERGREETEEDESEECEDESEELDIEELKSNIINNQDVNL